MERLLETVGYLAGLALCFAVGLGFSAGQAGVSAEPLESYVQRYDRYFSDRLNSAPLPGGAFAVVAGGRIVHIATFGTRDALKGAPVNADTVFPIASVSKTFAGTLTAMLVAEDRFTWEDPLVRYVPDFRLKDPAGAGRLTVRHALSHSTGLVPNAYDNLLEAGQSVDKIIPKFRSVKPLCRPGRCYGYQNIVFSLIEPVIEKSTGQSYDALVRDRLFAPLGMDDASIGYDAFLDTDNHASPHIRRGKTWRPVRASKNYYRVAPAAGVNASITDLAKWLIAQMGYRADVLSPDVIDTLTTPQTRTRRELYRRYWRDYLTEAHYGVGWRLYRFGDEMLVHHGGGIEGFRASLAYSREHDIGLAILINAESRVINELATHFWADLFEIRTAQGR
ncbi:serine hydrolase domain-containing protein [Eilatimonas milleporae]|uniref:Beta-lactamase class C n=1 Tax=Eilatimonas milleporae TaxID=911205 RepID=A0A3M0CWU9_9PROT|nr:serine hydrolase domain-containing protein [Eilatimonas milleporae]RMB11856.1 beta-lactamase class C [Eilatimonas milleporae]